MLSQGILVEEAPAMLHANAHGMQDRMKIYAGQVGLSELCGYMVISCIGYISAIIVKGQL